MLHQRGRVGLRIGQLNVGNGNLRVLAVTLRLAAQAHHLEPGNLQSQGNQFLQPFHVTILFMQEDQYLLRQVFGDIPLYMRCREGHDPFTQLEKDPLSFH